MSKLNYDNVVTIATDLSNDMSFDENVAIIDRSKYYEHLPKGIKQEQADIVNAYNNIWAASTGLATGMAGTKHFETDGNITEVSVVSSLGHAEVEHKLYREYKHGDDIKNNYLVSGWSQQTQGEDDYMARMIDEVANMGANGEMEA